MAYRGCVECLLKLLNLVLTLVGLAMVGYGIYLKVVYERSTSDSLLASPVSGDESLIQIGRPLLMRVSLSSIIFHDLPKAWFIYLFIRIGAILFIVSCFGYIGAVTRNGCCLTCYSVLVILLILLELGYAGLIFFDKSWEEEIPTDSTGDFESMYDFLKEHWEIVKWVALGAVVLEALLFLLALVVRAANRSVEYDSDDNLAPRHQASALLVTYHHVSRFKPVTGNLHQRTPRSDDRNPYMKIESELDTIESRHILQKKCSRLPHAAEPKIRSCCTIL